MWRLLLFAVLCAFLFAGTAEAQVDRNAGSRGTGVKKPRKQAQAARPDAAKAPATAQLSPAALALAKAIAAACMDGADLRDTLAYRRNAATTPVKPPQPAAQPPATAPVAAPVAGPKPATPAPVAKPEPPAPQEAAVAPPPVAQAKPVAKPEPAPPSAPAPLPEVAPQPKPEPAPQPKPDTAAQPDPEPATPAAPPPAAPAPAPAQPAAPVLQTETVVDAEAAAQPAPGPPVEPPAKPKLELKPKPELKPVPEPEPVAPPATAIPDTAPVAEPAPDAAPASTEDKRPERENSAPAKPTTTDGLSRQTQDLNARRPLLKPAKRVRPPEPPAATDPQEGVLPAEAADTHADAALLSSRAGDAAAQLQQHAGDLPTDAADRAEPAMPPADAVTEPMAVAEPDMDTAATAPAEASDPAAAAPAEGFDAPFTPRSNNTTLDQLTSRHQAPERAAPLTKPLATAAPQPEPAAEASFALPAAGATASAMLAPLNLGAATGTLAAAYGGGAPVELVLPHIAPQLPAFPIKPGVLEVARGNPKKKQVALTFDDGPHPACTSQLLAELAYYRVPVTFFFTGMQAQKYPQWVRMAHQAGHEIGNHTYDHFRIPKLPRAEQEYQIDEYQRLVEGLTGEKPRFLRPPGGQLDKETLQLVAARGLIVAMWDVNINDAKPGKSAQDLLQTTLKNIRPGSVILAHDGIQSTIDMLPELITTLREQGYTFVTMSELASGL